MSGETDRLRYTEYRVYGYQKYGKTDVTLDLLDVAYDVEVDGVKNAYSATLAAAYELSERMKLGADVEYSKNPDFDKDIRTLVKLTYSFDTAKEYSSTHARPSEPTANPAAEQTPVVAPEQAKPAAAPEQVAPVAPSGQDKPKEGN